MFNLQTILLIGLAVMAGLGGAYTMGRFQGSEACDARHAAAAQADYIKRVEEGNILSAELESDLAASRNFYIDLKRKVSDEVSSNIVYASCIVPANGVFLVNSAIAGRAAR